MHLSQPALLAIHWESAYILYFILIDVYLYFSIKGSKLAWNSERLTKKQKIANIALVWLIPFIWYFFIKEITKTVPGSFQVPVKDDVSGNHFHESGKGVPYANIKS